MLTRAEVPRVRPALTRGVLRGPHVTDPPRFTALILGAVLLLLGAAWLSTYRTVSVVVDGQETVVETHAITVGDLLERADLDVAPGDHVEPPADTRIVGGMTVEVVHARNITLLVGDAPRNVRVAALTVEGALEQLSDSTLTGAAGRRDLVRPSRSSRLRSGMVVELSDPVALTVAVDGERWGIITDEPTVGHVVERLGVELGPHDRLTPDADAPVEHGAVVTVARVEVREEVREEALPFQARERRTDALPEGERRVARAGAEGLRRVIERVTYVDGVEESREQVGAETVREPTTQIIEIGTAPRQQQQQAEAPAEEADSEEPESAHNHQTGRASWYDNPYGGYTAAHRTLPRGTIVTVTNVANGRSVQVRINDRGPYVEDRIIDLNRKAFAELASPSRGVIDVRIEW